MRDAASTFDIEDFTALPPATPPVMTAAERGRRVASRMGHSPSINQHRKNAGCLSISSILQMIESIDKGGAAEEHRQTVRNIYAVELNARIAVAVA